METIWPPFPALRLLDTYHYGACISGTNTCSNAVSRDVAESPDALEITKLRIAPNKIELGSGLGL